MPRRVPSYNPTVLRIWRMLKRMGITSPLGIFLSLVFWSLFICFSYFSCTELSKLFAKIEARKFQLSQLGSRSRVDNETLLESNFRQLDAFGLFKTYWSNKSNVEVLMNYVKGRTRNISAYIPG